MNRSLVTDVKGLLELNYETEVLLLIISAHW